MTLVLESLDGNPTRQRYPVIAESILSWFQFEFVQAFPSYLLGLSNRPEDNIEAGFVQKIDHVWNIRVGVQPEVVVHPNKVF
jgi:hypothetical protein